MAAALGNDYLVAPDVVIYRDLYEDCEINAAQCIVDGDVSRMADIRKANGGKPLLHASVSAKYTMRSDRAQNSRTEALNLIRNRKGHLPHIVVVTAEPMPPMYSIGVAWLQGSSLCTTCLSWQAKGKLLPYSRSMQWDCEQTEESCVLTWLFYFAHNGKGKISVPYYGEKVRFYYDKDFMVFPPSHEGGTNGGSEEQTG